MGREKVALGKKVGVHLYLHVSALRDVDTALNTKVKKAAELAALEPGLHFNVIKLNDNGNDLSLLHYPGFFEDAFPVLSQYWSFDLGEGTFRFRTYTESFNPPVLHRKELLCQKDIQVGISSLYSHVRPNQSGSLMSRTALAFRGSGRFQPSCPNSRV